MKSDVFSGEKPDEPAFVRGTADGAARPKEVRPLHSSSLDDLIGLMAFRDFLTPTKMLQ